MKTLFVLLLIGVLAGAFGWQYYQRNQKPTIQQRAAALAKHTEKIASQTRDAVAAKAEEWKLTPDDIRNDLAKTGRVVRDRAVTVGEKMDDARIIAVIKGKYVVEKNLSSFDISVSCKSGEVNLTGVVGSESQVGEAVGLALQTSGVHRVVSHLEVRA